MKRKQASPALTQAKTITIKYDSILAEMVALLETARHTAARAVNSVMTATYWEMGRRIVEVEQGGKRRAEYGEQLLERLAQDLTKRFGRGFSMRNLRSFRAFYIARPIRQTVSAESTQPDLDTLAQNFPLPWSHYVLLLSVEDDHAREFYETEALRGGWSVRQLNRQIGTQFYQRTALSRNKAAMLTKGAQARPEDVVTPEEEIKDPLVLEFLGLKDEYSESELEEALIKHLEAFLLELGSDFAFVGRQKRLRIDDAWYRIDLLFFHRRLRCLIIIDLKLNPLTPADVGQMHLYCNYARHNWTHPDENPPVGLILCAGKGATLARYALEGLPNQTIASNYLTELPDIAVIEAELQRTRKILEARRLATAEQKAQKPAKSSTSKRSRKKQ